MKRQRINSNMDDFEIRNGRIRLRLAIWNSSMQLLKWNQDVFAIIRKFYFDVRHRELWTSGKLLIFTSKMGEQYLGFNHDQVILKKWHIAQDKEIGFRAFWQDWLTKIREHKTDLGISSSLTVQQAWMYSKVKNAPMEWISYHSGPRQRYSFNAIVDCNDVWETFDDDWVEESSDSEETRIRVTN